MGLKGSGEDCIMRIFVICTATKYYSGDQIGKNEMGGVCGTHVGEERGIQNLGGEMREIKHLEDQGVNDSLILKRIFKK